MHLPLSLKEFIPWKSLRKTFLKVYVQRTAETRVINNFYTLPAEVFQADKEWDTLWYKEAFGCLKISRHLTYKLRQLVKVNVY